MKLPSLSTTIRLIVLISETVTIAKEWIALFRTIARHNAAKAPEDFG